MGKGCTYQGWTKGQQGTGGGSSRPFLLWSLIKTVLKSRPKLCKYIFVVYTWDLVSSYNCRNGEYKIDNMVLISYSSSLTSLPLIKIKYPHKKLLNFLYVKQHLRWYVRPMRSRLQWFSQFYEFNWLSRLLRICIQVVAKNFISYFTYEYQKI